MAIRDKVEVLIGFVDELKEFDFTELSIDNVGSWPVFIKIAAWACAFIIVLGLGYHFIISDLRVKQENAQRKEEQLKNIFTNKAFMAANLGAYRKQMAEMEESFGALVNQLPSDTEVPGLLEDITNKGSLSGLEIKSIDLGKEKSEAFYVQLPIDIVVQGSYHDMGAFVSGVASLPRIVTLTDFVIKPIGRAGDKKASIDLEMAIRAYTYRYKDIEKNKRKSKG